MTFDAKAVAELAPTGTLRAAINLGNPVLAQPGTDPRGPKGVSVHLARELARRLDLPLAMTTFDAAGKAFQALQAGEVDIAFLANEPARAAEVAFTAPYVLIEGTYVVRTASPFTSIEEFDRPGLRIAVGRNAAYDLFLSRTLKHAELVRAATSAAALDMFYDEGLDAGAGVRQPLREFAEAKPGLRVIDGHFQIIRQSMCTAKQRPMALALIAAFIEDAKANGSVARGLRDSGQDAGLVAPL